MKIVAAATHLSIKYRFCYFSRLSLYGTVEARGYCYVVHWDREGGHPMVPSPHDQVSAVTDVVRAVTHELLYRLRVAYWRAEADKRAH